MSEPITWLLLGGVAECMQRIRVENGFNTDAGSYVTREPHQIQQHEADELVAVAMDGLGPPDAALARIGNQVGVLVVAKVKASLDNAQLRLHQLIDDILRAMDNQQGKFPGGTHYPRFVEARLIPPAEGMEWIGAEVRFSAQVRRL